MQYATIEYSAVDWQLYIGTQTTRHDITTVRRFLARRDLFSQLSQRRLVAALRTFSQPIATLHNGSAS